MGWFAILAILTFWIIWFLAPQVVQSLSPQDPDYRLYEAFKQAFILADSWLAINSLGGAIRIATGQSWGFLCMLLAGGSGVFLGFMDLFYDLQHGVFAALTSATADRAGHRYILAFL